MKKQYNGVSLGKISHSLFHFVSPASARVCMNTHTGSGSWSPLNLWFYSLASSWTPNRVAPCHLSQARLLENDGWIGLNLSLLIENNSKIKMLNTSILASKSYYKSTSLIVIIIIIIISLLSSTEDKVKTKMCSCNSTSCCEYVLLLVSRALSG